MNKINIYNQNGNIMEPSKVIKEGYVVPMLFELKNMRIDTKEDILKLCKYLNRAYHDRELNSGEWVCSKQYATSVLLVSEKDILSGKTYYIEISKGVV